MNRSCFYLLGVLAACLMFSMPVAAQLASEPSVEASASTKMTPIGSTEVHAFAAVDASQTVSAETNRAHGAPCSSCLQLDAFAITREQPDLQVYAHAFVPTGTGHMALGIGERRAGALSYGYSNRALDRPTRTQRFVRA